MQVPVVKYLKLLYRLSVSQLQKPRFFMHIIHPINDFLFELFPKAKAAGKDLEVLRQEAEDFYTVGSFKPTISIIHDIVDITIEGELIEQNASLFKLAAALCDGHRFEEAKKRLEPLLKEAPHISEYHRILGQILSGQGEQDKAINGEFCSPACADAHGDEE